MAEFMIRHQKSHLGFVLKNIASMRYLPISPFLWFSIFSFVFACISPIEAKSGDADALLSLKLAVDPYDSLPWRRSTIAGVCSGWKGIKECSPDGRVTKLVLEFLNLTGDVPPDVLSPLGELRVLSFKSNYLSGPIPDLSDLPNLKSLYLSSNRFSGNIPATLAALHRLKVVVLSENLLSGPIPPSLTTLPRLYTLYLQDNRLTGKLPPFNQPTLRFFNVSTNALSGEIPATPSLSQFNLSSFANNPNLCGGRIQVPCSKNPIFSPSLSPEPLNPSPVNDDTTPPYSSNQNRKNKKKLIGVIAGAVAGFLLLFIILLLLPKAFKRNRKRNAGVADGAGAAAAANKVGYEEGGPSGEGGKRGESGKRGFSWEGEGLGKLVFCGGNGGEMYSLEDLLRASAETLGRGTAGSTYKAVMESGFIVTVKRLKDSGFPGLEEFRMRMEMLGRLRHPNLVPLRAYFQAKEERLLVYDYFPNGSLFSLIHGSRASGSGKPLHWTSCLKIGEDVAAGLLYLHQSSPTMVHGNLKSSNVLLGPDFESCITDYGLVPGLRSPDSFDDPSPASSLFYRAPESRNPRKAFTQLSDIYSFGVLLLELLTGKTPFQDLVEQHGADIPRWVRSVREEETESGDEPTSSGNEGTSEDKLAALLSIAMACVSVEEERRPPAKEVVRMIREARAEAMVSSNSSEQSPGRWSDTVQSLPREHGSEHMNFAERD